MTSSEGLRKRCSVCWRVLSLSEFYIRRDRNKPLARCKRCNSEAGVRSKAKWTPEQKRKALQDRAEWYAEQARKGNLKAILQHKLCMYKGNAKRKGVTFDIDVAYLIELLKEQKWKCYYTGQELNVRTSGGLGQKTLLSNTPNQFSLDRLIPQRGYTRGNVVWCTYLVNTIKNMLTEEEFYKLCGVVLRRRDQREL